MKASEAKKVAERLEADAKNRASRAATKLKKAQDDAQEKGKVDAQASLEEIYQKVKENVRERSCHWIRCSCSEDTGGAYIHGMEEVIKATLTADGYKVTTDVKGNYARIFEGYMNPEVVGYEFVDVQLTVELGW